MYQEAERNESGNIVLDQKWERLVRSFAVEPGSPNQNYLQRDGAAAIVDLMCEYQEGRASEDTELIARVLGRLSDVQVRDFALGAHSDENLESYWQMWSQLLRLAPAGFIAPVACIYSSLAYERGDKTTAMEALDQALDDDPTYVLAPLLRRVFRAGWPPATFAAMRQELHPKVCKVIFG